MQNNPHRILGVSPTATPAEIKKAYKKLAQKHHPDRGGDEAKFKEVQSAYDTIKDGKKSPPDIDLRDEEQFSEFIKRARAEALKRRTEVRFRVSIELSESVQGGEHFLQLPIGNKVETIKITIPAGVTEGAVVRYHGLALGNDLLISFSVLPAEGWTVQGLDLIQVLKVSIWDLIKGTDIPVKTMHGTTIKLKIPKGTQPETMLRVKGKGIQAKSASGDMHVYLQAVIPDNIHEDILSAVYRTNS